MLTQIVGGGPRPQDFSPMIEGVAIETPSLLQKCQSEKVASETPRRQLIESKENNVYTIQYKAK